MPKMAETKKRRQLTQHWMQQQMQQGSPLPPPAQRQMHPYSLRLLALHWLLAPASLLAALPLHRRSATRRAAFGVSWISTLMEVFQSCSRHSSKRIGTTARRERNVQT